MFEENIVFSKVETIQKISEYLLIYVGRVQKAFINEYLVASDKDFHEPLSTRVDLKTFAGKLHNLSTTFIIVYNQEIAGIIASYFYDLPSRKGFITLVHVKHEFRGQHFSDLLVQAVQAYAQSIQFKFVDLVVYRDNTSAFKLYSKHGFKVLSEENGRCLMRWMSNQ